MSITTELPYSAVTGDRSKPLVDPAQPVAAADTQIAGGYASVADMATLYALPTALRRPGMRRKVLGDDGFGTLGRVFELGSDLLSWAGQPTATEIRSKASGVAGKNLLDPAAVTAGQFMGPNGLPTANASFDYSARIPVTPGVSYSGQGGSGTSTSNMRFVTFWDATGVAMTAAGLQNVTTFTAPAGAASVTLSVAHSNLATFQFEVGAAPTFFEPYTTLVLLHPSAVRDYSLGTSKYAEQSITPSKVTFLVPGKNLFNKAAATIGYYLGSDGSSPTASSNYDYSDFIPVTPGQVYSGRGNTNGMRFVTYYDANRVVVAGGPSDSTSPGVVSFTPPAGIASVRVTIYHADLASFQLEAGARTAFSPYSYYLGGSVPVVAPPLDGSVTTSKMADRAVTMDKAAFFRTGKNLFDKATVTVGSFMAPANGLATANPTFDYSDFIPVTAGQTYRGQGAGHGMRFITYFDASRTLIPDTNSSEVTSFTPIAGASFVRLSMWHADLDTFQLEVGAARTAYNPFQYQLDAGQYPVGFANLAAGTVATIHMVDQSVTGPKIAAASVDPLKTTFLVKGKNLFDKSKATPGYFRGNDGSTLANAQYGYSDYIAVTPGQQLVSSSPMRFTTFYGASKGWIAGGSNGSTSAITVPAGVAYVIVTYSTASIDSFQLEVGTAPTAYQAYGYTFTPDVIGGGGAASVVSGWNGKTWATLGDSITAGNTWQAKAAIFHGMSYTNFGIGGTKVSGVPGDANAMCQDTRINAIATTFDFVSLMGLTNDWAQNVPLGDLDGWYGTASFDTNIMTVSAVGGGPAIKVYDTINAPGVAAGTYVVSFGTGVGGNGTYNLSTTPGTLAARRTRTFDPTTVYGALNTFADKAFARWPAGKIAAATTPYGEIPDYAPRGWSDPAHNTLGLTTNDYADAVRKFAARRNVALIDVALYAGWASGNIDTYLNNGGADRLHPAPGSPAALGISAVYKAALRNFEPLSI